MASHEPALPQTHSHSIGIEVADGGTNLTAILSNEPSARRWRRRLTIPPSPDETVSHIHELIERVLHEASDDDRSLSPLQPPAIPPIAAIGIALWGTVDTAKGIVRELRPHPEWRDFPLVTALHKRLPAHIVIASATAAAALAEARHSANAEFETLLYVHLGRTISCAAVRNGSITLGAHTGEGMLAHMLVSPDGPRCSCGLFGHLEPIASAQAIVRTMIGLASDSEASTATMLEVSHGRAEAMSAAQVIRLATEGEPTAARVVSAALDALALALANTVAILTPDTIVFGGPLREAGEAFLTPLRDRLDSLCRPFATPAKLRHSKLEPFSSLLGAHLLAQSWHNT